MPSDKLDPKELAELQKKLAKHEAAQKAEETTSGWVGLIALLIGGFLIYFVLFSGDSSTPEEIAAAQAEETAKREEDKRLGFHCLSAWDGSHPEFKRDVIDRMRDPGSFEHISTLVTPVSTEGTHDIVMEFRAKNGFGGMNRGTAVGTYSNSTCTHLLLSVQ